MLAEITLDPVTLGAIVAGIIATVGVLYKALMAAKDAATAAAIGEKDRMLADKDKAIKELDSLRKSYQEMATEGIKASLEMHNYNQAKAGLPPLVPLAPVIPESHSPPNPQQIESALISTMRATMAQIKLESGQEPRKEPE